MTSAADALPLLARFAERTRTAMLADGWEIGGDGSADGSSIFLGDFQRSPAPDFLATVQFILESGPEVRGFELRPLAGLVRTDRFQARVGGEFGLRHLPTERLLRELEAPCDADISLDIADVFEAEGRSLPVMTDESTVDEAARVLVEAVVAHALPFQRAHASVDGMFEFVKQGRHESTRTEMFEYIFVPALLAASGRATEARAALSAYRDRITPGTNEELDYARFSEHLTSQLG